MRYSTEWIVILFVVLVASLIAYQLYAAGHIILLLIALVSGVAFLALQSWLENRKG